MCRPEASSRLQFLGRSAPDCKPDQQLCCQPRPSGKVSACACCVCAASAPASGCGGPGRAQHPASLSSASPLWVCPRCDQPVARGTCSVLLCSARPPHPVCLSAPGVRRTPGESILPARAVVSLEGEGAEEPCRAGRHVTRSSCVLMEAVCPRRVLCPCGARVSMQSLCPHGARVSTRAHHQRVCQPLVPGST